MLANGATLAYKTSGETYTNLPGLKELPEIGEDPEKVENTVLTDSIKQYEKGIGDPGDMTYKFKYKNTEATDSYRLLKALETANTVADFKETLSDGTTITYKAQVSTKISGGGVNGVIEFDANMMLQSGIDVSPTA